MYTKIHEIWNWWVKSGSPGQMVTTNIYKVHVLASGWDICVTAASTHSLVCGELCNSHTLISRHLWVRAVSLVNVFSSVWMPHTLYFKLVSVWNRLSTANTFLFYEYETHSRRHVIFVKRFQRLLSQTHNFIRFVSSAAPDGHADGSSEQGALLVVMLQVSHISSEC